MRHHRSSSLVLAATATALALAACSSSPSTHEPGQDPDQPGQNPTSDSGMTTTPAADAGPTTTVAGQSVPFAHAELTRTPQSSVSAAVLHGAVASNNAFAVNLYGQLRATSASQNLLTSPLSASIALTMTYAGAQGTTATQMASALHYGSAASSIFEGQNALSQALASRAAAALKADQEETQGSGQTPSPSDYQFQVVNSVWGETGYPWKTPFLNILAQDYGTGVYQEDFAKDYDAARALINTWVSDETNDKIQNLLPEGSLDNLTRMVLVNAVHIKLPWANPFTVSLTRPASFTTEGGATVQTPFMNQTTTLPFVDDGTAQIVGLPLSNNQLGVVIAFPHKDLASYEASLTASSAGLRMPTYGQLVQLSVPKVTFTSPTFSMKNALTAMGMPVAFDKKGADFQGLCVPTDGENLYINDVLQKAMIAMQETGVEAAAATAVIIGETDGVAGGPPPQPVIVDVNRPYVLSIVDVPTGALLFVGHIVDPTQTGGS